MNSEQGRRANPVHTPAASLIKVTAWQDEALATALRRQLLHKE